MTRGALVTTTPAVPSRGSRHGAFLCPRAASLVLALGLTACNASGLPPAGDPQLRWTDPAGRLTHVRALADSVLADVTARVKTQLDVAGVIITVIADGRQAIGGYGLGGRTHSATDVRLYIDADYPHLAAVIVPRLAWLAAHELHHAARWRSAGYGSTLLEAMVSEGLADRYAEELLRAPQPP